MSVANVAGAARLGSSFPSGIAISPVQFDKVAAGLRSGWQQEGKKDKARKEKERVRGIEDGSTDTRLRQQRAERTKFRAAGLDSPHRAKGAPYRTATSPSPSPSPRSSPSSKSVATSRPATSDAPSSAGEMERNWRNIYRPQQTAIGPGHPMGGRQWVDLERADRPTAHARPMGTERAALPGALAALAPHPADSAVNRDLGQMTMFPNLPHETAAILADPRTVEQKVAAQATDPGYVHRQGMPSAPGSQGYLFRPKSDKEQEAARQRAMRTRNIGGS